VSVVSTYVDMVMPVFSETMTEGTILGWLKAPGDLVAVGDDLVEIETEKVNVVYQSDTAGSLTEILAGAGQTLPVGTVIARIRRDS
jgi:pyruvate/2-oxoglutarate dehydrogenase complex dihydrolipoamide acyltransferase (E2) component